MRRTYNTTQKRLNWIFKIVKDNNKKSDSRRIDHQSWENLVRVAPQIAGALNQTSVVDDEEEVSITKTGKSAADETHNDQIQRKPINRTSRRRKRYIQAVAISNARPRQKLRMWTQSVNSKQTPPPSEMFRIGNYLELVDDDVLGSRVVFQDSMDKYIGRTVFDICNTGIDKRDFKKRFIVALVNSSRILLNINNFSLSSLIVVATSARTLDYPASSCERGTIECQVIGTRVCVDEECACDGLPNCGSNTMYDEDKTTCNTTHTNRTHVYLTAVVFLLALFVLIYLVYYWLQRCVPKVSDAFFIYTENTENVLYLDTIMRSPHEHDIPSETMIHTQFFEDDIELRHRILPEKRFKSLVKSFRRFLNIISLGRYESRRMRTDSGTHSLHSLNEPKQVYSFAEMELMNMTMRKHHADAAVQTGDSMEMMTFTEAFKKKNPSIERSPGINEVTTRSQEEVPQPIGHKPSDISSTINLIPAKDSAIMNRARSSIIAVTQQASNTSQYTNTSAISDALKELNAIRFMKRSRSSSTSEVMIKEKTYEYAPHPTRKHPTMDEEEIYATSLSRQPTMTSMASVEEPRASTSGHYEVNWRESGHTSHLEDEHIRKKLRFEDGPTTISFHEEAEDIANEPSWKDTFLGLGKGKKHVQRDLPSIEEEDTNINAKEKEKAPFRGKKETKKKKGKNVQKLALNK